MRYFKMWKACKLPKYICPQMSPGCTLTIIMSPGCTLTIIIIVSIQPGDVWGHIILVSVIYNNNGEYTQECYSLKFPVSHSSS